MPAKYQNLGKQGILYTHTRPKFWHQNTKYSISNLAVYYIPKVFGRPCYVFNQYILLFISVGDVMA